MHGSQTFQNCCIFHSQLHEIVERESEEQPPFGRFERSGSTGVALAENVLNPDGRGLQLFEERRTGLSGEGLGSF